MTQVLNITNLDLSLRTGEPILQGLTLSLDAGRVLGVIGESGAGKSMLGAAIANTLPLGIAITAGEIRFQGQDLFTLSPRERRAILGRDIAYIPQEAMQALNPGLSIGRQMSEHLQRLNLAGRSEAKARAAALLADVGIPAPQEVLKRYPHQLSGGMLQRVLIALAFAGSPRLVVADEPTTALDVSVQARVVALLKSLCQKHQTAALFITHDLELAGEICDEAAVLYAGQLVEYGPAKAVIEAACHPYSRCLSLATPKLSGPRRALYSLNGRMPGVGARGREKGCSFAPRCPVVQDHCTLNRPALSGAAGHLSACHYPAATTEILAPKPITPRGVTPSAYATLPPVLKAEQLSKTYVLRDGFGRKSEVQALKSLSFTVYPGEFLGVVGESGSGKSTLTKLIVGLEAPSGGALQVAGVDRASSAARDRRLLAERVQLIFQDPQSALNPRRRVEALVTQAEDLHPKAPDRAARQALVAARLQAVMLPPEAATHFPDQLSGGQKQRVNIARALGFQAKLLVADEIVSGLDVSVQAQILELLAGLRQADDLALLLISHDLAVVRQICDRVLVMKAGEIVEQGPVDAVFSAPKHPYTAALLAAAQNKGGDGLAL